VYNLWKGSHVGGILTKFPSARVASETFNTSHSMMKSMLNRSRKNTTNLLYYEDWNNINSNQ
jgi:hypothetical protein